METYDIVVIGAGPGGYPAAIRAAQLGAKVAIIEREAVGGTCLNWGCIPTKTLIASATLYHRMVNAEALGIRAGAPAVDYAAMAKRKDEVVAKLRGGVETLLKGNGVTVLRGTGAFRGRNRIAVTPDGGGDPVEIAAGKTIVATGSTSVVPGFLPKHPRVVESRAFLDLKSVPKRVLVLGGGVIGCEFACLLASLGVQVTVVELLEDILFMLDADVRKILRKQMEAVLGVRVMTGRPLEHVQASDRGVTGLCGGETLEADLLLCAIGRRPVTDGLALDRAGLATSEKGFVRVDEAGRTDVATVYAIGDVTGGPQLAHAATSQGIVAAEDACGHGRPRNESVIPACIFTSPEIGQVGLGEEEAARLGRKIQVGRFPFQSLGKALASGEPEGFAKWVADAETGRLLGAAVVGPHATDLIAEATAAIRAELTVREIGRTVHAHPTLAEVWMEAAHAVHGESIHAAPRKKVKAS